ncbi:hypothetical protein NSQ59_27245 [Margalitia sp. FSL K6-0131]|uniref:hypothetical protein n=1 Tax=Margalitia sp. FSL K6-0131 TaxID=2954604 RepID=UPI0030F9CFA5
MIYRGNNYRKTKRVILVILLLQTLFFFCSSAFLFMNVFNVKEGTIESYQRLDDQKKLFKMPQAWILNGPWNLVVLHNIKSSQEKIIKQGIKKGDKVQPFWISIEKYYEEKNKTK